jgi:hypothetical protein
VLTLEHTAGLAMSKADQARIDEREIHELSLNVALLTSQRRGIDNPSSYFARIFYVFE